MYYGHFFKWYKFIIKSNKNYDFISAIKRIANRNSITEFEVYSNSKKYENVEYTDANYSDGRILRNIPKIINNIPILTSWLFLWPTSLVIFILGDLIWNMFHNFATMVANWFSSIYSGITNYALSKLLNK